MLKKQLACQPFYVDLFIHILFSQTQQNFNYLLSLAGKPGPLPSPLFGK
jgi:hypothetical protein